MMDTAPNPSAIIETDRAPSARAARPSAGVSWRLYLTVGAAVCGGYFLLPSSPAQDVVFDVVGASAVAAILIGVRRNGLTAPFPWFLFAGGLALFVVGDTILNTADLMDRSLSFPSPADILYLAGYPFLAWSLILLERRRTPGRDRTSLLDAGIIACGAGLLSWVYVMSPVVQDPSLGVAARAVSVAYPLLDLLLLGVAVKLAVGWGVRSVPYWLLLAGLMLLLVADTLYTLPALTDSYHTGSPVDAGWLLSYLLLGAAALHPAGQTLSQAIPGARLQLTKPRLFALAAAIVLAPVVLLVQAVRGASLDLTVISVGCILLFFLVLVRTAGLVREVERGAERVRVQEILLGREQEAVAKLTELNRMKTEFVAIASHELRTPLTSLIGYTKTLLRPQFENDAATRKEFLLAMERQGSRLLGLVENLLTASTVEGHRMDRSLELVDVRDLCVDVLEGLQDRAERVRVVMQEGDRTLLTDRRLLGRAVANLVDNALKYSAADSGCEVHVTWDEETVRLSVQDQGMGIAPDEHDRIFERFYQVDSSDTRRVGGVGLGLSLVREIVESLEGTVAVDSALGRGSTFTISLPAA